MLLIVRIIKLIQIALCAFFLAHCAKVSDIPTKNNQSLVNPYTMPAAAYLALAKNQTGDDKQSQLIMAAGRMIYDGQWQNGLAILSRTSNLSKAHSNEKRLLLAKIDLMQQQPRNAIAKLATVQDVNNLPIYYQVQFHEMLANAYQSVGNPAESITERIKLEKLLPDDTSKANNRRVLWLTLTKLPIPELDTLALEAAEGSELKGWLQLALISRKQYDDSQSILTHVEAWQAQNPGHPGNYILPSPLTSVSPNLFASPKKMALLLPITGPLAGPGNAIKDGFMAAHQASHTNNLTKVRIYNTDSADVAALYQQAVSEGADYIVGPLSKANVATVAPLHHPVPTLLLNEAEVSTNSGAYQFGLSPSNEARQVAQKARKKGYTRALVIAPAGAWGDEVVAAFASQWRGNAGRIVDTLHYQPQDDMNAIMRDFLHITDSEAREKKLKQLLGDKIESIPTRRQDFDVIFLLAYPSKAGQIMPLLKYYYAGDMPVYAISTVYSGHANPMKDRDLDGIIFCDMPWVFEHQMGSRNWPEQFNSYNRLYALGMDSYAMSSQLNQLLLFPAVGVSDNSGALYLSSPQQISRILVWGQFRQGLAKPFHDNQG